MSKRELKSYLKELKKKQLEEQIIDLYERFKEVKEFYDFAFNPNESKLIEDCKFRITKEYFPVKGRKAKMRRSVAQKFIKHFIKLGVDCSIIADIMIYNIEIAQTYSSDNFIRQESFYKSMLKSFTESVNYITQNNLKIQFIDRLEQIVNNAIEQKWINHKGFDRELDNLK